MISEVESAAPTYIASDGMFGGNNWLWIIVLLLFFGWGNGFGKGNGLTQAELQAGLYNQTTDRNLSDIRDGICGLNQTILTTGYGTDKDVLQNRYDNALGQCGLQKDILLGNQSIQSTMNTNALNQAAQLAECCCDLKTAIHAEGEATRQMMQQDKIEELRASLNTSTNAYNNLLLSDTVTKNVLNSLGDYYPRIGVNPYSMYNCYGCGSCC